MTDSAFSTVPLGRSEITISPLGLGAWSWGDRFFWGYGDGYGAAEVAQAYETSLAAGITFIDTAEVYGFGQSERLLSRLLAGSAIRPVVTTKFFPYPWRIARSQMRAALRASLRRLGLKQVDLYLIHWPWPPVPAMSWVEGLADVAEMGLTRLVGVSNFDAALMRRAHAALAARGIPLSANQVEYSLLQRAPERNGVLDACRELGVTLIAYSPLAMGLLTGKYTLQNPPPGMRRSRYNAALLERLPALIGLLGEIGAGHRVNGAGRTAAQVALNWVISKGAVPIPGAKNGRQAADNAGALGWTLTPDEIAALERASDVVLQRN